MRIAICDDSFEDLEKTANDLRQYLDEKKVLIEIVKFSHPDKLIEQIKTNPFDVYILDIIMPMYNGIEVGKEIRKVDKVAKILYLTTSREYAISAFSVQAINYVVKPYEYSDFKKAIDELIKECDYIVFPVKDGVVKQSIGNFICAETNNNYSIVYFTFNQEIKIRMTLQLLMEKLKDYQEISMVGSSYIVNFLHIKKITNNTIFMDNDKTLTIPRRSIKDFKDNYFNYYMKETMK